MAALRAYGRTVGISAPDAALQLARERLPPAYRPSAGPAERCWTVRKRPTDKWLVLVDGVELSEHDGPAAAAEAMLSDLELWVAEHTQRAVFVHAGCVVAGGRAILIPGYSMSGKTSLTAALVRAGAIYYSDEFAVLDHRGLVRPYPRSLSVRTSFGGTTRRVPISELGGRIGRGPAPVGLIAALRFDADAGWNATPDTRTGGALALLQHTISGRLRPRASLHAIKHATADAIAIVGTRGDADSAAAALLKLLPSEAPVRGGRRP